MFIHSSKTNDSKGTRGWQRALTQINQIQIQYTGLLQTFSQIWLLTVELAGPADGWGDWHQQLQQQYNVSVGDGWASSIKCSAEP